MSSTEKTGLETLDGIRAEIDRVDNTILDLLHERATLVSRVALIKTELGLSPHQPGRFEELQTRLSSRAQLLSLDPELVPGVWASIHQSSLRQQGRLLETESQDVDH